jgi:hypothetical protein
MPPRPGTLTCCTLGVEAAKCPHVCIYILDCYIFETGRAGVLRLFQEIDYKMQCLHSCSSTNPRLPSEQQRRHLIGERSATASTQEVLHHPPLQPSEPNDGGAKPPVLSGHNASRKLSVAP